MTVGDKRLRFGRWACGGLGHSPPVALSRLAALWREQEGFRHQNRHHAAFNVSTWTYQKHSTARRWIERRRASRFILAGMRRWHATAKLCLRPGSIDTASSKCTALDCIIWSVEARSVEEVNRTKGILNTLRAQWSEGTQMYHEGPRQPEFTLAILTVRGSNCVLRRTRENPRKRVGSASVGS
jgi:hypothetical protein